ncbi:MAG TPA: TraR/DksA family transcriptional regulator [Chakrabartia sp.]|jgi:RNA polymerase-binding protein DksA|nr:TraR/DksA family transcriptional regulator [Chakrabartia sp.]
MSSNEEIRAKLTARLDELAKRADSLEAELSRPLEADSEEQAISRENEETMEALEDAALQEIEQIRGALTRLDNGHYGACAKCGEDIAPARLDAMPTATRCINCASA